MQFQLTNDAFVVQLSLAIVISSVNIFAEKKTCKMP